MNYEELEAFFRSLDRSLFVEGEYKRMAHVDHPLPIGFEQTISQPSLVLEMTFILGPDKDKRILEIGTGSGYQTAMLAEFAREVYTVELIPELSVKAEKRLRDMGYENVRFRVGDGSHGWKEHAPYEGIMVTAAVEELPLELLEQLAVGGKMLVPVGPREVQELMLIRRKPDGTLEIRTIEMVRFVELKGKYGWNREE